MTAPPSQGQPPWGTKQLNGPVPSHTEVGGTHRRAAEALTPSEKLLFPEPTLSPSLPPPLLGSAGPPARPPNSPRPHHPPATWQPSGGPPHLGRACRSLSSPSPPSPGQWSTGHCGCTVGVGGEPDRRQARGGRGSGTRQPQGVAGTSAQGPPATRSEYTGAGSPRNPHCPEAPHQAEARAGWEPYHAPTQPPAARAERRGPRVVTPYPCHRRADPALELPACSGCQPGHTDSRK